MIHLLDPGQRFSLIRTFVDTIAHVVLLLHIPLGHYFYAFTTLLLHSYCFHLIIYTGISFAM